MYTQCPECEVAFRVTADVLKQAAGKVRCGGCGVAFNALAHLSEEMPGSVDNEPETANEPAQTDEPPELQAGSPPQAISAEQSAALLKTLDQLAGEDIRIEDTGVEWRVMDADEDELDEALADDPVPNAAHEEMRFDDNTPLPDDFDLDTPTTPPPPPEPEPEPEPEDELENSQVDLVFGEPDEWEDLLGDLDEAAEELLEAEAADQPLDVDTQFELQAEELGLKFVDEDDAAADEDPDEATDEDPDEAADEDVEDKLETSIEEDLIAAAFEVEAAARQETELDDAKEDEAEAKAEKQEINLDDVPPEELTRAGILDEDDYLEDLSEAVDEEEIIDEIKLEASPQDQMLAQEVLDDAAALEAAAEALANDQADRTESEDEVAALEEPEEAKEIEFADALDVEVPEQTEEERTINMQIDQELLAIAVEDDDGFTSTIVQKQVSSESDIPAESKSDKKKGKKDKKKDKKKNKKEKKKDDIERADDESRDDNPFAELPQDDNPLMETIIMEGESVVNEQDEERLAAARVAASKSLKEAGFENEKTGFDWRSWQPPRQSMAAAAAILAVILIIQVIHHSREALAVSPAFQNTIAPVYRMAGSPITPAWDVKGWRFEATKGSTNEAGDVLTIYSRIGNNSDQTLPYPLVHVSLTDRFEEIIGSRVLEPADYLVDDADPSVAIKPRETFNAVIAIESPSAAATSFKLNVCYRLASGQLRCADKDFR